MSSALATEPKTENLPKNGTIENEPKVPKEPEKKLEEKKSNGEEKKNLNIKEEDTKIKEFTVKKPLGIQKWPDQMVESILKKGFYFNIMCVGEASTGKSTLIESLFDIRKPINYEKDKDGNFNIYTIKSENSKSPLTIQIASSCKFGTHFDHQLDAKIILDYVNRGNKQYLKYETSIKRTTFEDHRTHLILFFLPNQSKALSDHYMNLLSKIQHLNVLPIIAKSDTLTADERSEIKSSFNEMLKSKNINLLKFQEDTSFSEENKKFNKNLPFAIVGSKDFSETGNGIVRARKYTFGSIDIEDPKHSEFSMLKESIIDCNLVNLIKATDNGHYGAFRKEMIKKMGGSDQKVGNNINKIMNNLKSYSEKNMLETNAIKDNVAEVLKIEEKKFKEKEEEMIQFFEEEKKTLMAQIEDLDANQKSKGENNKKKK